MRRDEEVLHSAAAQMRAEHGPDHQRHGMWSAIADWLDLAASPRNPYHGEMVQAARTVADEYLRAER